MENNKLNRRDFIVKGAKTVVMGALALSSLDVVKLVSAAQNTEFEQSNVQKVINLADYPELATSGGYAMITEKVIVIRKSKSKFIAINISCTHKKCDVEYDGSSFECPCHGSTFDNSGKVTGGPASKNLKSYRTTFDVNSNTLTIDM